MNNLYEALEVCLEAIEQGADIDTVLSRYPDLADELRPILETSRNASSLAVPAPTTETVRRNRAKVLQRAAQMRESKRSSRRIWFASLRRVVVALAVVAILFVSGTGLVRAASTTVPGDQLYPVKRTWEDVLVLLTFNSQQREALEIKHENERLHELRELFAERRGDEDVDFAGLVTSQNGNEWVIAGVPVTVSPQTEIRGDGIGVGSAVRVEGHTQSNGAVLAEEIKLLPPDAKLPDVNNDDDREGDVADDEDQQQDNSGGESEDRQEDNNSGKGSEDDASEDREAPESESGESSSDDSDGGKSDSGFDNEDGKSDDGGSDDTKDDGNGKEDDKNDESSDSSGDEQDDSGEGDD